jgi:hypothetical protein
VAAAEDVQLPAGAEVRFVGVAVAIETRLRIQHLAQRRLHRLVGPGGLRAEIARRQQRRIRRAESGPGLRHAGGGLRKVEILLERLLDIAGQLRIAEAAPPRHQLGVGGGRSLAERRLANEAVRQGRRRPDIVRPHGAACKEAEQQGQGKRTVGHGIAPGDERKSKKEVSDYNSI